VNLAVGSEGFIPSLNTVISGFLAIGVGLLAETNEYVAVLESVFAVLVTSCPKPAYSSFSRRVTITYKRIVPFVLVKVCDLIEFALYHRKNYRDVALSRFVISATLNIASLRRRSQFSIPYLRSFAGVGVVPILRATSSGQFLC